MLNKYEYDREATKCLKSLLKDDGSISHFSELWTDKGYLKHLTDEAHKLFVEIEIIAYDKLVASDFEDMKSLHKVICNNGDG